MKLVVSSAGRSHGAEIHGTSGTDSDRTVKKNWAKEVMNGERGLFLRCVMNQGFFWLIPEMGSVTPKL